MFAIFLLEMNDIFFFLLPTSQFGHSNQAGLASPRSVLSGDADSWDSWDDAPSEIVIGEKRPETVQDHIQV